MDSASHTSRPWYAEWFGRDYLDVYAHRDQEEAARQIDLMERVLHPARGARVQDLCCGGGRHSVELARRGYRVAGIDLSQDLLDRARNAASDAGVDVEFIRSDMRCVVAAGAFDVVVNFFTSFGYFDTDEENARVLHAIRKSLRPGGCWMMDYLNRDEVVRTLTPSDSRQAGDLLIRQERHIDAVRSRVNKTLTVVRDGDARTYHESVRMYSFPEMLAMLRAAGLRVTHVFGADDGRPFTNSSPRLLLAGSIA